MHAAIFGLGPLELVIVIVVILVLFLPALLPKILKRLGETVGAIREMSDKVKGDDEEDEDV